MQKYTKKVSNNFPKLTIPINHNKLIVILSICIENTIIAILSTKTQIQYSAII